MGYMQLLGTRIAAIIALWTGLLRGTGILNNSGQDVVSHNLFVLIMRANPTVLPMSATSRFIAGFGVGIMANI